MNLLVALGVEYCRVALNKVPSSRFPLGVPLSFTCETDITSSSVSGADPGFVEGGGAAQRRSRLKTLFGISKGGGGAQGACALFDPP